MPGETENIAQMAEKVSKEIFGVFGWDEVGERNQNWACVHETGHILEKDREKKSDNKENSELPKSEKAEQNLQAEEPKQKEKSTHPSDVVFSYDDPYEDRRMYFNVDLKSYGAKTLKRGKIREALETLAYATDCANISSDWTRKYAADVSNRETAGLLFVWNHDGEYDPEKFESLLKGIDPLSLRLPEGRRIYVIGPREIAHLTAVATDIERCRGRDLEDGSKEMPKKSECSFYYPDLVTVHPKAHNHRAASIEMLLSPWQVLRFTKTLGQAVKVFYYVYYNGGGTSVDEFKYLIDYFFRYQLLDDNVEISLRMPFASSDAATLFAQARDAYAKHFYDLQEFRARLDRIKYSPITRFSHVFSTEPVGMNKRKS